MTTLLYRWLTEDERELFCANEVVQIVADLRRAGYRISYDHDGWYVADATDACPGAPQSFYAVADLHAQL